MSKWTKHEIDILEKTYGSIKIESLQEKLPHRTIQAIQKKAQYLNLIGNQNTAQKIYNINIDYFDKPNIDNSYWAGFLAADGYLNREEGLIKITLSEKDRIVLDNLKKSIDYDGPTRNADGYSSMDLWGCKKLIDDLYKNWNIHDKNKSAGLQSPKLDLNTLKCAYIIGYFDGGGTWYSSKGNHVFGFCGTKNILEWINNTLNEIFSLKRAKIYKNGKSNINFKILWNGKNAFHIRDILYEYVNTKFRLKRKWGRLRNLSYYLCGPIDKCPNYGKQWRDLIIDKLHKYKCKSLDPLNKPFDTGIEDTENIKQRKMWKEAGKYDLLKQDMKIIRNVDLRMVDLSDFIIANLDMNLNPCGTWEEIFWANRQKNQ